MNDPISRAVEAVEAMPRRVELLGGQHTSYVQLAEVVTLLQSLLAASQPEAEAVIVQGLSDDTTGLARFGHHPDPAIDFCIEVETLESRLHQAEHGLSKPGTEPETVAAVLMDIQRAMDFRVGGDEGAVNAKHILRGLEARATPAPVVPADQRAAIEALADRMWRVHPKDIHAAGYEHLERGGKYENPRAAWYADQIEALFKQFRDQVSPVVPAEGLDAEHLVAAWLDEMEVFATRRERLMDDVLAECDLAPWLHAACQVGIDAALRSAQPVGARVRPWETRPAGPDAMIPATVEVHRGAWAVVIGTNGKPAGWVDTHDVFANQLYRDHILTTPAALLPAGEGEE